MDEVIMEALEYISPKKIDEVQQILDNKKAPPKKPTKVEEVVIVDLFEGKDSAEYKNLARQIKS